MAKINIGKVRMFFKGEWNENTPYEFFDWVTFEGSSYLCLNKNGIEVGTSLVGNPDWVVLAQKGQKGDKGDKADKTDSAIKDGNGNIIVDTYATKNELSTKEPIITKNTGFNLNKSDAISSTSTSTLATSKAVKTAYDKGVSAYNLANDKEPIIIKKSGFNLDKSDAVDSNVSTTLATSKAVKTAYDLANTKLDATANAVSATKAVQDGNGAIITDTYATKSEVSAIPKFKINVVSELPSSGKEANIYLVTSGAEDKNLYDEYIWVTDKWEKLGTQKTDLTDYALKSSIPTNNNQLINGAGYITASTLTPYVKTSELNSYLSKSGGTIDGNLIVTGDIVGKRVYNKKTADYAECFDNSNLVYENVLHRIVEINNKEEVQLSTADNIKVIGVVSDNYGHLMGGTEEEVQSSKKIPVGLAGTLYVDTKDKLSEDNLGKFVIADKDGYCKKIEKKDKNKVETIVGKIIGFDYENNRYKVLLLLK